MKLKKAISACLLSIILLTTFVNPVRVSAAGLFGGSWIDDTSLYWNTESYAELPDSFTIECDVVTYENLMFQLKGNLSQSIGFLMGRGTFDTVAKQNLLYAFHDYITNLNDTYSWFEAAADVYNSSSHSEDDYTVLYNTVVNSTAYSLSSTREKQDALYEAALPVIGDSISRGTIGQDVYGWYRDVIDNYFQSLYEDQSLSDLASLRSSYLPYDPDITSEISIISKLGGRFIDSFQGTITNFSIQVTNYELWVEVGVKNGSGVEQSLSTLLINTADRARNQLARRGIDVATIIYGRVSAGGGTPIARNNFQFEFAWKNIYGLIGAVIYSTLRALMTLGIILAGMALIAKAAFANSAKAKDQLKDNLAYAVIALVLMYIMPNLVDVIVYLKDLILSVLGRQLTDFAGAEQIRTLTDQYRDIANSSHAFFDACMYLGFVILSLYFAVVYISAACSMAIVFGFFPLFLLLSFKDRKLLSTWLNFIVGTLITPVVDCALLYVPIIARQVDAPEILIVFTCFSILPARGLVRSLLGFGATRGSEAVGLGAMFMAGRAVGSITRTATGTVRKITDNVRQTASDWKRADMEEQLADITSSAGGAAGGAVGTSGIRGGSTVRTYYNTDAERYLAVARAEDADYRRQDGESFELDVVSERIDSDRAVSSMQQQVQAQYGQFANKDNFENPEIFNNLSHEQKAALYRRRAIYNAAEAVGYAGRGVGAAAGGSIGLGAGTFLGPGAMAMMGIAGAEAGGELGESAGLAGMRAIGSGLGHVVDVPEMSGTSRISSDNIPPQPPIPPNSSAPPVAANTIVSETPFVFDPTQLKGSYTSEVIEADSVTGLLNAMANNNGYNISTDGYSQFATKFFDYNNMGQDDRTYYFNRANAFYTGSTEEQKAIISNIRATAISKYGREQSPDVDFVEDLNMLHKGISSRDDYKPSNDSGIDSSIYALLETAKAQGGK